METGGFFKEPIEFYLGRIPFIITDLITQLDKIQGQNSKVLFNRNFTDEHLEEMILELKSNRITNWSKYNNPANLSVALSIFINSIFNDEPLITEDVQETLLSIQLTDSLSYLKLLRSILLKLHSGRFQTLSYLTSFFSRAYYISENKLFCIFSLPFYGKKSMNLNSLFLKQIFQILVRNHDTVFQGSVSKAEAFLTNEEIDLIIAKHFKGETIKCNHIKGNLTPRKLDQNELEKMIKDANSSCQRMKYGYINSNENIDLIQCRPTFPNYPLQNAMTQTDDNPMPIIKKRRNLQINKPFVYEAKSKILNIQQNTTNYSSYDDFSSSKTNSQNVSSSATSSTTSSYSFYSYTRLEPNLSKYDQLAEPVEINNYIENINGSNSANVKTTTKVRRSRKNRSNKDRSDTSDNISYSDNIINNNSDKIPKPPPIPDCSSLIRRRKKTNYAANHSFSNEYFYTDKSSENNTNNYNENKDNDKSDSQNGIEVKFDFYKNLVNTNTNEVLPPAPMLDPELLSYPIFRNDKKITDNDFTYEKRELPPPPLLENVDEQFTSKNINDEENSKHVSFHLHSEANFINNSSPNYNYNETANENNDESSNNSSFTNSTRSNNIDEDDSSLASSWKKEEEDKKEYTQEEDYSKKDGDDKEKKNFHIFKHLKRKNEKKKKDDKKSKKKDKLSEDEKKSGDKLKSKDDQKKKDKKLKKK